MLLLRPTSEELGDPDETKRWVVEKELGGELLNVQLSFFF